METISIRLNEEMMRKLEALMKKHHFATLTEFVREAIRIKMKELEQEDIQRQIARLAGSSKRKTSDEDLHKVREKLENLYNEKFK